jgi:hypothetical protein
MIRPQGILFSSIHSQTTLLLSFDNTILVSVVTLPLLVIQSDPLTHTARLTRLSQPEA